MIESICIYEFLDKTNLSICDTFPTRYLVWIEGWAYPLTARVPLSCLGFQRAGRRGVNAALFGQRRVNLYKTFVCSCRGKRAREREREEACLLWAKMLCVSDAYHKSDGGFSRKVTCCFNIYIIIWWKYY